jgi:hypothetical protein
MEAIGASSLDRLQGTSPTYDGRMDLTQVHPLDQDRFRIKITLKGDGTSTPTLNWAAVSTILNTPPVIDMVDLERSSIKRMESTTITFRSWDETDPYLTTGLDYRTSSEGPWIDDIVAEMTVIGDTTTFTLSPEADDPTGQYEIRLSSTDRSGVTTHVQEIYLGVENRMVSQPEMALTPSEAFTDNIIRASVTEDSIDPEGALIKYRFYWYVNWVLVDPEDPEGPEPGWEPENISSKESTLSPAFTTAGDNITCKVYPTDLIEDGPPAVSWLVINNSPPKGPDNQISVVVEEDTTVTVDLTLSFSDADEDVLEFSLEYTDDLSVDEISHGVYNVTPSANLNGEYLINVSADDGSSAAYGQISITYTPLNDRPYFQAVLSKSVQQGASLNIPIIWHDPEDPDSSVLIAVLPDTWGSDGRCIFDRVNSTVVIEAGNGNVGVHDFLFRITDPQGLESVMEFNITVTNINDPIESALIVTPSPGDKFEVGEQVVFTGDVIDPDKIHGQEFFYTWVLVAETIGTGKTINYTFNEPGTYVITLEASEGAASKSATVEIVIEKKDDGGGGGSGGGGADDDGSSVISILFPVVAFVFFGMLLFLTFLLIRGSRKKHREEEEMEEKVPERPEEMEEPEAPKPEEMEAPSESEPPESEPEPAVDEEKEPDIMMPSEEGILMPEDIEDVHIPQVEEPTIPEEPPEEETGSDMEYYSPSKK